MAKIINLDVSGMTCGKCERLIREGISENIKDIKEVLVDRPGGKVNVHLENSQNLEEQKEQILSIINSLVNGKFKATIESGTYILLDYSVDFVEYLVIFIAQAFFMCVKAH